MVHRSSIRCIKSIKSMNSMVSRCSGIVSDCYVVVIVLLTKLLATLARAANHSIPINTQKNSRLYATESVYYYERQ